MYKKDLALNNLQCLICYKTKPNQIIYICNIYMYKECLASNNLQGTQYHKTQLNQISNTTCCSIIKEPHFSYYLSIGKGRIVGFIPLPSVLLQCKVQTVTFKILIWAFISNTYFGSKLETHKK